MENRVYGYARVSSKEQNADRQVQALKEYGVDEHNIIIDKKSGRDMKREGYASLKNFMLRSGDTLVVKELDRLSRSKADIKKELEYFKEHRIRVKILDIPTTLAEFSAEQEWVMDMINTILIEVLGSMAEAERLKIRQRQREGIDSAKQRGVKFGRPRAEKPPEWDSVMEKVSRGIIRPVDAMRELGLKKGTYYNLIKRNSD
ncbi:MAG: recombinase family protein [Ruminococcus flavefaciens]|nr:recombinase family protein [Ruminococcus flavefaciens]